MEGLSGDTSTLEKARAAAIPEPADDDIPDNDDLDDTYIVDGVVPPLERSEEDEDDNN